MKHPALIRLDPIQSLRSIYGTRYRRPGMTAAYPWTAPDLMQMDAPKFLPAGSMMRTGNPHSQEAIIHASFLTRG